MQRTIPHLRFFGDAASHAVPTTRSTVSPVPGRRGGAVIIVVLALLSLMIFLGVFFFEFVQEELTAAGNYKTNPYGELLNPDEYFEQADKQLIIGPESSRTMSALWAGDSFSTSPATGLSYGHPGTPHSLLAHVIGRIHPNQEPTDVIPHNGHGITTSYVDNDADALFGPGDYILFDLDGDGVPDATLPGEDTDRDGVLDPGEDIIVTDGYLQPAFGVNFSRPAQSDPARDAFSQIESDPQHPANALRPFQPDVDYTYPDINNLFLAYDRIDQRTGRRILVPSFHRPELFPQLRDSNVPPAQELTETFRGLYQQAATQRLVLRPHANHKYPDDTNRFLTTYAQAQSGNRDRFIPPFPFEVDQNGNGKYNEMGIYSYDSSQSTPEDLLGWGNDLDVDLTGDGEPDGIWMDLGLDLVNMADGRQFVPLFSFYILDADGLINLNAHGNLRDEYFDGSVGYADAPFSISNTGASASEVNPIWALTGNPQDFSSSSDLSFIQREHAYYFGFSSSTAQNRAAMANMELSFLLRGRPLSRSGSPLTGRYGEESRAGNPLPVSPTNFLPRPGYTGTTDGFDDDDDDDPSGSRYQGGAQRVPSPGLYDPRLAGSATVVTPHASHPLDLHGGGSSVYSTAGRKLVPWAGGSPVVWPQYDQRWEVPVAPSMDMSASVLPVESPYPYAGYLNEDTNNNNTLDVGEDLNGNGVLDKVYLDEDTNSNGVLDSGEDTNHNGVLDNFTASMIDEEDETRLANPDRRADDIFVPDENLALHVSDSDFLRVGGISRLKNLAPFNFNYARDAALIRRQFTTDSWDLSELTYAPWRYNTTNGRLETSEWVPASMVPPVTPERRFFPPEFGNTLFTETDPMRPELRALLALEETDYPEAGGSISARRESFDLSKVPTYTLTPSIVDNVTPTTIDSNDKVTLWRQPLNLNKLHVGFDEDGYPIYRDLMPHPDMYETFKATSTPTITIPAMIHDHDAALPSGVSLTDLTSGTTEVKVTAQEWWARYDRQRMARDIYTLLYLLSVPNNGTSPAIDPSSTVYPQPERIREMAQFAVNYVDALDRDDVITKFEYDDDLSNGWDTSPTKHVYGIERASLSFSEVQFLQTKPRTNVATTLHDDDDLNVHQYLHMELRNSSPFEVKFAEGWRISRVKRDASGNGTGTRDKSVEFKTNGFGTMSADAKTVPPGGNFLIGTHDGNVVNGAGLPICSDLYGDVENGAELELILPSSPTNASINTVTNDSADPNPVTNLDLGVKTPHPHTQYFTHVNGDATSEYQDPSLVMPPLSPAQTPPTHLVRQIEGSAPSTPAVPETGLVFDLVLERRQNPHGVNTGGDSSSMGDWIEVDRFEVRSSDMGASSPDNAILEIANPGAQAEVLAGLLNLNSVERRQPFDPVQIPHVTGSARNHTIEVTAVSVPSHAANSAFTGTSFTLWQPHFDRDLTSAYELLSVPLYGNWPLTELVAGTQTGVATVNTFYKEIHGGTQFNLAPGANGSGSGRLSGDFTAGIRFNFPNGIPGKPYQGWNPFNYQNAWYRLFDFVTVPRRADQQSEEIITTVPGSTKPVFRVPGKINLNTLRDETVLAALQDDETHLTHGNFYSTQDNVTAGRNWYQELLQSRDGVDYFAENAAISAANLGDTTTALKMKQLAIPNSISSRPFRNSSKPDPYASSSTPPLIDDGVENGLLRSTMRRSGVDLAQRPVGANSAYTTPTLTSPTNFSASGLWSGTPPHNTTSMTWQGLFDAGDLANTGIDHHTRNRILAKIANNSTTKSHVFFVWTAVGYFEAHQINVAGVNRTQIGARLSDIPIHRRFSVVDMSKIDEAYDPSKNMFEASKFIIFQKRLR